MCTLVKIIVTSILNLSLFSCNVNFNLDVTGNGKAVSETPGINASFQNMQESRGLHVDLVQNERDLFKKSR